MDSLDLIQILKYDKSPKKYAIYLFYGLYFNADVGFDTTEFRDCCYKNDIMDNIKHN